MERKRILIADNDPREIQELRNSLVSTGFEVRIVDNGASALKLCREFKPHLVLSEIKLPKIDGHHLLRELRSQSATKSIPFVLMSRHRTVDERVHSIRLGVDDYISKPFDVNEVIVRLENILKEIELLNATPDKNFKGFAGKLNEMNLADILKTLEIGKKSAVVEMQQEFSEGLIYVKHGEVYDVILDSLNPNEALSKLFLWSDGVFRVRMGEVERAKIVNIPTHELLYEGIIRRDRWEQICKKLPPLQVKVRQNEAIKDTNLTRDEKNVLNLINGKSRIIDLIESSQLDDLQALDVIASLIQRGRLQEVGLDEDFKNGHCALEKDLNRTLNGNPDIEQLISKFLYKDEPVVEGPKRIERRRSDRRRHQDRRLHPRRREDFVAVKNKIYLTKSEIFMIRENLLQSLNHGGHL